jgi:RimJ/RimL family protein N-acetyltransferase
MCPETNVPFVTEHFEKLGFEKVGISDEKIIRDGNTIDSIIMSLDKKTFLL